MNRIVIPAALLALLLSASFIRNGTWQDDRTLWSDALAKSPDKVRGMNELGLFYESRHEYERAIAIFLQSMAANRYQPMVYINLGIAYEGMKRYDDAVSMYRTAMTLQPDDPVPCYNLGILLYNHYHNLPASLDLLQKARDRNPNEPDVHLYLGYIYRDLGDAGKAEQEFGLNRMLK